MDHGRSNALGNNKGIGTSLHKYDAHLTFRLPEDFYIVKETEDVIPLISVKSGKSVNDEGEDTYEYSHLVEKVDIKESPFTADNSDCSHGFSLDGNFENYITVTSQEMNIAFFSVTIIDINVWINDENNIYCFRSRRACDPEDVEENEKWIKNINTVISSAEIDWNRVDLKGLTVNKVMNEMKDASDIAAQNSDIPYAKPADGQHTHLDYLNQVSSRLSIFGAFNINNSGTEYSFQQISDMAGFSDQPEKDLYKEIISADISEFDLVETAHDMSELFRVDVRVFDSFHDREQDILAGFIQKAELYNKFRSFAWTFAALCNKEKIDPAAVDFSTIEAIVEFIEERDCLNYSADSFSPTICSGDDIHVFYIPDSVPDRTKRRFFDSVNKSDEEIVHMSKIRSLDGLRKDLDYMYPAIRAIYDKLEAERDREEVLEGGVADILYVWCSMTYASRGPIFSEDGPMNCMWDHPDDIGGFEIKWRIEQLENSIRYGKEWTEKHNKDLSRGVLITFKDKTFVFDGVESDELSEITTKLNNLGGIVRTAVSGKTNYLVCNPAYAGESKVRNALEQRNKGKDVNIVLFEDFLKAIKITVKTPQEKLDELKKPVKRKQTEKHLRNVVRPESKKESVVSFSYKKGLVACGDGYTFELPDDFVITLGEDDRDFIAYIPDSSDPDNYLRSDFVIYAGTRQEYDALSQFRIPAEYSAMVKGMSNAFSAVFSKNWTIKYMRDDLPGAIVFGYDTGCLHANAFLGVDKHVQMIRMQINGVDRRKIDDYTEAVKELFDHMKADKKVKILESVDSKKFSSMTLSTESVSEWCNTIDEYIQHIIIARNLEINGLMSVFEQQQEEGNADVEKLKKDLKNTLRDIVGLAENILIKAEFVYVKKRAQYPTAAGLKKMEDAIESLIEITTQELNLDEEHIEVRSEYALTVKDSLLNKDHSSAGAFLGAIENKLKVELAYLLRNAPNIRNTSKIL